MTAFRTRTTQRVRLSAFAGTFDHRAFDKIDQEFIVTADDFGNRRFGRYEYVIRCILTVEADERVFRGGGRRKISVAGYDGMTGGPGRGHGRDAVARLTRQPRRARRPVPLAHYRVPPGQVGQRQAIYGRGARRTVAPILRLPAVAAAGVVRQ